MKYTNKIYLMLCIVLLIGFSFTAIAWQRSERENAEMKSWIECLENEAENLFGDNYIKSELHSRAKGIANEYQKIN